MRVPERHVGLIPHSGARDNTLHYAKNLLYVTLKTSATAWLKVFFRSKVKVKGGLLDHPVYIMSRLQKY